MNPTVQPASNLSVDPQPVAGRCPRCYLEIDPKAIVCGHCQFPVQQYLANFYQRSTETMHLLPTDARLPRQRRPGYSAWKDVTLALGLAVFGFMFALVPVLGPLVTYGMWLVALGFLLSACGVPVASLLTRFSAKAQAAEQLRRQNSYTDAKCPSCHAVRVTWEKKTVLFWPNAKDGVTTCPLCKQVCYRFSDRLLWVPHPQVTLTGKLAEYLQ